MRTQYIAVAKKTKIPWYVDMPGSPVESVRDLLKTSSLTNTYTCKIIEGEDVVVLSLFPNHGNCGVHDVIFYDADLWGNPE